MRQLGRLIRTVQSMSVGGVLFSHCTNALFCWHAPILPGVELPPEIGVALRVAAFFALLLALFRFMSRT